MINLKVIFLFLALYSFVSAQWVDVSPEITAPAINDIAFFRNVKNSEHLLLVGDNGIFFIGQPGYNSLTVSEINLGVETDLYSVEIFDEGNIWVGGHNFLAYSTDTAQTFTQLSLPEDLDIRGLNFVSPDSGYFYTYGGFFAKTFNGGISWQIDTLAYDSLNAFQLLDNNKMIIVGDNGLILISPQNEVSWRAASVGVEGDIKDVEIASNGTGYLCTTRGYKTTDFGETWYLVDVFPKLDDGYIEVAYSSVDDIASLYDRHHNCYRLQISSTSLQKIPNFGYISGANFYRESNKGFLVFGDNMFVAASQGSTNYQQLSFGNNGPFRDAQFINKEVGFLFGSQSFYTINGGLSWNSLPVFNTNSEEIQGHFFNLDHGLILISSRLYKTYDRGITWTNVDWFRGGGNMYFNDDNAGYIAAYDDVYKSTDLGEHWVSTPYQNQPSYYSVFASDMLFFGDSLGFIFDLMKGSYRTTDAGQNWIRDAFYNGIIQNQSKYGASDAIVTGMWSSDNYNFYSFGLVTTDRGGTWTETFRNDNVYCDDVLILPSERGLLVTSNKMLKVTIDGGFTWSQSGYPFPDRIQKLLTDHNGGIYAIDYINKKVYHLNDLNSITVGLEETKNKEIHPDNFTIYQNYPNPFNPATSIKFAIPVKSDVVIEVYNLLGQKVATLVNSTLEAGNHQVEFDAKNLSSGVYIYSLRAGDFMNTRKMILLK